MVIRQGLVGGFHFFLVRFVVLGLGWFFPR